VQSGSEPFGLWGVTIAFKASSSKGKSKVDDDDDPFDNETMVLLLQKMGRFMKKRGYGARKRRTS
jgi:hypothetical protein